MKNLFKFIEDRYPEYPTPFKAKLIYYPESITEKDLIVKGDLDLHNTKITQLPDNLQVEGSLNLRGTKITQLPDNLKVKRSLDISKTPITKFPNNIQVGEAIHASDTPITSLPDKLQVGWGREGGLYLYNTKISEIPKFLEVNGDLGLGGTPLVEKYTRDEIKQMIKDKFGYIAGNIYMT